MPCFKSFSLNIRGELYEIHRPQVMGIVNVTPDSFYSDSRTTTTQAIKERVAKLIDEGADMLDIGGYSSRPGADDVTTEEEIERLSIGLKAIRSVAPHIPVSVDTFRAIVAEFAVTQLGADIINDISGGDLDPDMFETVARLRVPYILMHMRGTPASMNNYARYDNVIVETISELSFKLDRLSLLGVSDIIVDPGFGFAKSIEQNYELLRNLESFEAILRRPMLIGISRKSMIYKTLGIEPDKALNGTTVLNTIALSKGASILRVHDVKEAVEAVKLSGLVYTPHNTSIQ